MAVLFGSARKEYPVIVQEHVMVVRRQEDLAQLDGFSVLSRPEWQHRCPPQDFRQAVLGADVHDNEDAPREIGPEILQQVPERLQPTGRCPDHHKDARVH
jgi:hypothetical protein